MDRKKPRVIQIGFNKTGTTSLKYLFKTNGYTTSGGRSFAKKIQSNIISNTHPYEGFDEIDLFQDVEDHSNSIYIYNEYEYIYSYCPNDYYVLTTRSCEAWIKSRMKFNGGVYANIAMKNLEIDSLYELRDIWRKEFYEYHYKVYSFFGGKSNFYTLSLDSVNITTLKQFLSNDYEFKQSSLPHKPGIGRRHLLNRLGLKEAVEFARKNY